jgi:hypothetical protein
VTGDFYTNGRERIHRQGQQRHGEQGRLDREKKEQRGDLKWQRKAEAAE